LVSNTFEINEETRKCTVAMPLSEQS